MNAPKAYFFIKLSLNWVSDKAKNIWMEDIKTNFEKIGTKKDEDKIMN